LVKIYTRNYIDHNIKKCLPIPLTKSSFEIAPVLEFVQSKIIVLPFIGHENIFMILKQKCSNVGDKQIFFPMDFYYFLL
jgi:hypothetical protein